VTRMRARKSGPLGASMSRRTGRPPKPTALKRLAGNPGRRALNDDDLNMPAASVISCPNWLDEKAQGEWRRITSSLKKVTGLLTSCDRAVLASYCQSWARWRDAEKMIAKEGTTITISGQHGYSATIVSPYVGISKTYHDAMIRSAREMGFTPSARSGVRIVKSPDKPTGADLLTPPKPSRPPQIVAKSHK